MKHIFLTGAIQVGKSTAIRRALEGKELILGGFLTIGGPKMDHNSSYVHIVRADGSEPLTPQNRVMFRQMINGKKHFQINSQVFEERGTSLLRDLPRGCDLILLDEIGLREAQCMKFHQAILDVLDGDIPALGVVQDRQGGFLDEVRNHPNVELLTVTVENREEIFHLLSHYLSQMIHQ